ncbi:conserved hypothetical protein [Leishmania infantum JPCM5]|uniref:Uncharacterized protein n=2 Tax=Leishmania infantum TaxID=5671 RepID=A4HW04_LEIIN|nr:conserved hypothetical protein [Leishmania infantum JPCM5]CAC9468755.1 hypothetical_protein_-_conserved [Leishmania infantum]CAM66623.1 conserved hypothetical protein [Leishmania infantum JPCM5]SUZ40292.1 hypothetical_protein_-_conserved [Leishmania infantum]|eukprot:XP_001464245.1 conserved hypothetical protein [Leishmania infantum JPCM5]
MWDGGRSHCLIKQASSPSCVLAAVPRDFGRATEPGDSPQLPSSPSCIDQVNQKGKTTRTRGAAPLLSYVLLLLQLTSDTANSGRRILYLFVSISPLSLSTPPSPSSSIPALLAESWRLFLFYLQPVTMAASGGDEQLDGLVDSILQSRGHLASAGQITQRLPSPQQREHTSSNSHDTRMRAYMHSMSPGGSSSSVGNFVAAGTAAHHALASTSRATATHLDTVDGEKGEEEDDLSTLVKRILAGSGVRGRPSTSSTSSPRFSQVPPPYIGNPGGNSTSWLKGATRMKGGSNSLSRTFGAGTASPDARMQAVVRRLTLWYERKEAKRVQAVYEALEREQLDCTFEPRINRLGVEVGGSVVVNEEDRPLHRRHHNADEYPRRPSASSKTRGSSGSRAVSHTNTISMSSSSSRVTPHMCEYIPSLQPPSQPITGADAFVERLRRAQDERDAVREAEEAKRLHYYDPATFRRDLTVPVPFEFVETRPRRLAAATTAAAGGSPSRDPGDIVGATRPSIPPLSARAAALAACRDAGATSPRPAEDGFRDVNEDKRLTPENTFLSLAPHIRQTLLFDRQMELQLRRATDSVRRVRRGE